ncbi:hypothetical protein [Nocardia aurea]|uniref:NACHT domain-containing protein n=1 Tax=Nocardia aurea TaxID=2144174 RepID=A0ABV3FY92_9NOCA
MASGAATEQDTLRALNLELVKLFTSRAQVEKVLSSRFSDDGPEGPSVAASVADENGYGLRTITNIVALLEPVALDENALSAMLKVLEYAIHQLPERSLGSQGKTKVTYRQLAQGLYIDYDELRLDEKPRSKHKHTRKDSIVSFALFDKYDDGQPSEDTRSNWTKYMRDELALILLNISRNPHLKLDYWITTSSESILVLTGDNRKADVARQAIQRVAGANRAVILDATSAESLLRSVQSYLATDMDEELDLVSALSALQKRLGADLYLLIENATSWQTIEAPVWRSRRCIIVAEMDFIPEPHQVVVLDAEISENEPSPSVTAPLMAPDVDNDSGGKPLIDQNHATSEGSDTSTTPPSRDSKLDEVTLQIAKSIRSELYSEAQKWKTEWPVMPVRWHATGSDLGEYDERVPIDYSDQTINSGVFTEVLSLYSKIGSGRLVILGEPGSGKTTIVRDFAYTIVGKYQGDIPPDDPDTFDGRIPVVFNLSSWDSTSANPKATLKTWMASILVRDHPGLDLRTADALIADRRVLSIFEGLDEMDERAEEANGRSADDEDSNQNPRRRAALTQLHGFDGPFVLTCRTIEYRETSRKARVLERAYTIELQPLSADDVATYLPLTANSPAVGEQWRSAMQSLNNDKRQSAAFLREVLKNPLMVYLASKIYASGVGEGDPAAFVAKEYASADIIELGLLGEYLTTVFPHPWEEKGYGLREESGDDIERRVPPAYPQEKVFRWLQHIAQNLDNGELRWWELANKVPKPITALVFVIFTALIGTAAVAVTLDHKYRAVGALVGAATGIVYGLFFPGQQPSGWSLFAPGSWRNFWCEAVKAPIYGATGAGVGFVLVSTFGWLALSFSGLAAGLTTYPLMKLTNQPSNSGWIIETRNSSVAGVFTGLIMGVVGFLSDASVGSISTWLIVGVIYGAFLTLAFGPRAYLQADTVATPSKMIASSRYQSIYYGVMNGCAHASIYIAMTNIFVGVVFGFTIGMYVCMTDSAWGRWTLMTRGWLPLVGKLPSEPLSFLEEAHRRGVLRQSGAVYLFRHKQLERYILEELSIR